MKKTKLQKITNTLSKATMGYINKFLLEDLMSSSSFLTGEVIAYKKVKVPRYLRIKIPVISRHYDFDSEYGTGEFLGLLISLKEITLFRIGTTTVIEPIYKKPKGKIKFNRHTKLKVKP